MRKSLFVIYSTILLDAVGIGLIFPILPKLLQDVTHSTNIAPYLGIMAALYAAMQFLFAPMLGAFSDRIGRRPVLLISLGGAAINYLFLAFATNIWMLFLGRVIAGVTSANMAVAMAYITDITPEEERAGRFGLFSSMFGLGFIIGPIMGGMLGDTWVRLPFIAAAGLNALNFLFAVTQLPETRARTQQALRLSQLNPFLPLKRIAAMKKIILVLLVFFFLSAGGEAYGTCWALWGFDAFKWNGFWVGLSLAAFGLCQSLVQSRLPGPATKLLGERWATLSGIFCSCLALTAMAFASQGWMVFALMPVFALGSIGVPAFQAYATRQVNAEQQGELQGVLTSVVSLASIIAPLAFTSLYFAVHADWPGAIWLSVVFTNLLAFPLVYLATKQGARHKDLQADAVR